ncbi:hypothetical protein F4778DRAFT_727521 [Xylariomycetidae sp. FL2044]|nr:hypothetical protein F4778DRAFT_727521 [Xylariomycetidae sp. FL2044]
MEPQSKEKGTSQSEEKPRSKGEEYEDAEARDREETNTRFCRVHSNRGTWIDLISHVFFVASFPPVAVNIYRRWDTWGEDMSFRDRVLIPFYFAVMFWKISLLWKAAAAWYRDGQRPNSVL